MFEEGVSSSTEQTVFSLFLCLCLLAIVIFFFCQKMRRRRQRRQRNPLTLTVTLTLILGVDFEEQPVHRRQTDNTISHISIDDSFRTGNV